VAAQVTASQEGLSFMSEVDHKTVWTLWSREKKLTPAGN
jgi:hypothetical protein